MTFEIIALLANIALTLSVIIAVIFGIAQVRTSNRDRKERLTLETLRNFQTREFAELMNYMNTTVLPKTYELFNSWTATEKVQFIQLMQQMESLGILLADKSIDIDLVEKTLGSFVTSSWKKYQPLIFDMRQKHPDPYLAEYFQWMAERIEKRMNEVNRKPFYKE
jgi:hypothetical protein